MYTFNGQCTYKLTGECEDNTFSVHLSTDDSRTELKVFFSGQEISMKNGEIQMGSISMSTVAIPSVVSGVIFERSGPTIIVDLFGTVIRWDGEDSYVLEPSDSLKERACGLCGNFDNNVKNDRGTIDSKLTDSALVLGNSWQMPQPEEQCQPVYHEQHYCEGRSAEELDIARGHCGALRSIEFIEANKVVDPEAWINLCLADFCLGEEGFCSTAAEYFREVNRHGVHVQWRNNNRCPMDCPATFVYKQCGSGCQQTCERHAFKCDETCIDGCHCPDGYVLHNNECIKPDNCPCYSHGEEYAPGSSIKQDCNTCFCENGGWSCTEMVCQSVCKVAGVNHFTTFDGNQYDFVGECAYTLVEPVVLGKGELPWAIFVKFEKCEQHVELLCHKSVEVRLGEVYISMGANFVTTVNDKLVKNFPATVGDALIEMSSNVVQRLILTNGLTVYWNGKDRIYVHAEHGLRDQVAGLCGTLNHRQGDDFRAPDGALAQSATEFGNLWRAMDICPLVVESPRGRVHPCEAYVEVRGSALASCASLMSGPFEACHNVVDVDPFYRACTFDYCACASVSMAQDGACGAIADYARMCAKAGVQIDLSEVAECMPSCPGQTVWNQCAPQSQLECGKNSTTEATCIEGCYCPEGLMLDRDGDTCVNVDQCTCIHDGEFVEPGSIKTEGCLKCTCQDGDWICLADEATCLENQVCPTGMEWVDCKTCQQHCSNMHIQDEKECAEKSCEAGCQCKAGLVYADGVCVPKNECPCFHGGKSFSVGEKLETECEDCVCNTEGTFDCASKPCWGACSVYGDPHYTTFDGKRYEFQGSCSYVFAQTKSDWGGIPFLVASKNIPCGSSGVTCTRDLELTYNGTSIQINKHSDLNNLNLPDSCTSWESGVFSFIKCNDDFVLKWDKGTRLSVSLNPKHKSFVEGLCGNYNDDQSDDFTTPSAGPPEQVASVFGDSWKLHGYCPKAKSVIDTCQLHPHRHPWAQETCSVIRSDLFSACHHEVAPRPFFDACVFDACGCDSGGDCECACTAIAAYAQECAKRNIIVEWRSEERCPMQCGSCPSEFSACLDACPRTCQNRFSYEDLSKNCNAGECVEGCTCGNGTLWDENVNRCVEEKDCTCGRMNGVLYNEGDFIPDISDQCQKCFCVDGAFSCMGSPCVDPETTTEKIMKTTTATPTPLVTTTVATTTKPIEITTRPVMTTTVPLSTYKTDLPIYTTTMKPSTQTPHSQDLSSYCANNTNYWSEWMNVNYPSSKTGGDVENIDIAREVYNFCPKSMITDLECRSTTQQNGPYSCTLENGLVCRNAEQKGGLCGDFEIRVYCECSSSTIETPTTTISTEDCDQTAQMNIDINAVNTRVAELGLSSKGWRGFPIEDSELTFSSNQLISVTKIVVVQNEFGEYPTKITVATSQGKEVIPIPSVPFAKNLDNPINAHSFRIIINSYEGTMPSLKLGLYGLCQKRTTMKTTTETLCPDKCVLKCSDLCHSALVDYHQETSSCEDLENCLKWEPCGVSICETGYKFNGELCVKETMCPCKTNDVIVQSGNIFVDENCTHVCTDNQLVCNDPQMTTTQTGCYVNGELVDVNTAWKGECGNCYCAQSGVVCEECTTQAKTTTVDFSEPNETTLNTSGPTKTTTKTFTESPTGSITTISSMTSGLSTTSLNPTVVTRTTTSQDGTTLGETTTTETNTSKSTETVTYSTGSVPTTTKSTTTRKTEGVTTIYETLSTSSTSDNFETTVVTTTEKPDSVFTTVTVEDTETTTKMASTKFPNGTTIIMITEATPNEIKTTEMEKSTTPFVTSNIMTSSESTLIKSTTTDKVTGTVTEVVTSEVTNLPTESTENIRTETPDLTTIRKSTRTPGSIVTETTSVSAETTTVETTNVVFTETGPFTTVFLTETTNGLTTLTEAVTNGTSTRVTTMSPTEMTTESTSSVPEVFSSTLSTIEQTTAEETTKVIVTKDGTTTSTTKIQTSSGFTTDEPATEVITERTTTTLGTDSPTKESSTTIEVITPTKFTTTVQTDSTETVTEVSTTVVTIEPRTTEEYYTTQPAATEQTKTVITQTTPESTTVSTKIVTTMAAFDTTTNKEVTVTEESIHTTQDNDEKVTTTSTITDTSGNTRSTTTVETEQGSTTTHTVTNADTTKIWTTSTESNIINETTTKKIDNPDLTTTIAVYKSTTDGTDIQTDTYLTTISPPSSSAAATTVVYKTESGTTTVSKTSESTTGVSKTTLVTETVTGDSTIELKTTETVQTHQPDASTTTVVVETTESVSKTTPSSLTTDQPQDCFVWDEWQNNNAWSSGSERESIEDYLRNSVCQDVMAIECRTVLSEQSFSEINPDSVCNIKSGFMCIEQESIGFNMFDFNNNQCVDYEIRIKCTDVSKTECYKAPITSTLPMVKTTTTRTSPAVTTIKDKEFETTQSTSTVTEDSTGITTTETIVKTTSITEDSIITTVQTVTEKPEGSQTTTSVLTSTPSKTTKETIIVTDSSTVRELTTSIIDETTSIPTTTTERITSDSTTDFTTTSYITATPGKTTVSTTSPNFASKSETTSRYATDFKTDVTEAKTTQSTTEGVTKTATRSWTTYEPEKTTNVETSEVTTSLDGTVVVTESITTSTDDVSKTTTSVVTNGRTTSLKETTTSVISKEPITTSFYTLSTGVKANETIQTTTEGSVFTTAVTKTFPATETTTGDEINVTEVETRSTTDSSETTTIQVTTRKPGQTTVFETTDLGTMTTIISTNGPETTTQSTESTTDKIVETTTQRTVSPDATTSTVVTSKTTLATGEVLETTTTTITDSTKTPLSTVTSAATDYQTTTIESSTISSPVTGGFITTESTTRDIVNPDATRPTTESQTTTEKVIFTTGEDKSTTTSFVSVAKTSENVSTTEQSTKSTTLTPTELIATSTVVRTTTSDNDSDETTTTTTESIVKDESTTTTTTIDSETTNKVILESTTITDGIRTTTRTVTDEDKITGRITTTTTKESPKTTTSIVTSPDGTITTTEKTPQATTVQSISTGALTTTQKTFSTKTTSTDATTVKVDGTTTRIVSHTTTDAQDQSTTTVIEVTENGQTDIITITEKATTIEPKTTESFTVESSTPGLETTTTKESPGSEIVTTVTTVYPATDFNTGTSVSVTETVSTEDNVTIITTEVTDVNGTTTIANPVSTTKTWTEGTGAQVTTVTTPEKEMITTTRMIPNPDATTTVTNTVTIGGVVTEETTTTTSYSTTNGVPTKTIESTTERTSDGLTTTEISTEVTQTTDNSVISSTTKSTSDNTESSPFSTESMTTIATTDGITTKSTIETPTTVTNKQSTTRFDATTGLASTESTAVTTDLTTGIVTRTRSTSKPGLTSTTTMTPFKTTTSSSKTTSTPTGISTTTAEEIVTSSKSTPGLETTEFMTTTFTSTEDSTELVTEVKTVTMNDDATTTVKAESTKEVVTPTSTTKTETAQTGNVKTTVETSATTTNVAPKSTEKYTVTSPTAARTETTTTTSWTSGVPTEHIEVTTMFTATDSTTGEPIEVSETTTKTTDSQYTSTSIVKTDGTTIVYTSTEMPNSLTTTEVSSTVEPTTIPAKSTADVTITDEIETTTFVTTTKFINSTGEITSITEKLTTYPATDTTTGKLVTVTDAVKTTPESTELTTTITSDDFSKTTKTIESSTSKDTTTSFVSEDFSTTVSMRTTDDTVTGETMTTRVIINPDGTATTTTETTTEGGETSTKTLVTETTSDSSFTTNKTTLSIKTDPQTYTTTRTTEETSPSTKRVSTTQSTVSSSTVDLTTKTTESITDTDGKETTTTVYTTEFVSRNSTTDVPTDQDDDCYIWDEWQSNSAWSFGDERESLEVYLANSVCQDIVAIECRTTETRQAFTDVHPDAVCNVQSGFLCMSQDFGLDFMDFGSQCADYEIRVKCTDVSKTECYSVPLSSTTGIVVTTTVETSPAETTQTDEGLTTTQTVATRTTTDNEQTTSSTMVITKEVTPDSVVTTTQTSAGPMKTTKVVTSTPMRTTTETTTMTDDETTVESTTTHTSLEPNQTTERVTTSKLTTITEKSTTDLATGETTKVTSIQLPTDFTTISSFTDKTASTVSTTLSTDGTIQATTTKSSVDDFTTVSTSTEKATTTDGIIDTTKTIYETTKYIDGVMTTESADETTTVFTRPDGTTTKKIIKTTTIDTTEGTVSIIETTADGLTSTTTATKEQTTVSPRTTEQYFTTEGTPGYKETTTIVTDSDRTTSVSTTFAATDSTTGEIVTVTETETTTNNQTSFSTVVERQTTGSTETVSTTVSPDTTVQTTTKKLDNLNSTTTALVVTTSTASGLVTTDTMETTAEPLRTTVVKTTESGDTTTVEKSSTTVSTEENKVTKIIETTRIDSTPDVTKTTVSSSTTESTPELIVTTTVTKVMVPGTEGTETTQVVTVTPTSIITEKATDAPSSSTVEQTVVTVGETTTTKSLTTVTDKATGHSTTFESTEAPDQTTTRFETDSIKEETTTKTYLTEQPETSTIVTSGPTIASSTITEKSTTDASVVVSSNVFTTSGFTTQGEPATEILKQTTSETTVNGTTETTITDSSTLSTEVSTTTTTKIETDGTTTTTESFETTTYVPPKTTADFTVNNTTTATQRTETSITASSTTPDATTTKRITTSYTAIDTTTGEPVTVTEQTSSSVTGDHETSASTTTVVRTDGTTIASKVTTTPEGSATEHTTSTPEMTKSVQSSTESSTVVETTTHTTVNPDQTTKVTTVQTSTGDDGTFTTITESTSANPSSNPTEPQTTTIRKTTSDDKITTTSFETVTFFPTNATKATTIEVTEENKTTGLVQTQPISTSYSTAIDVFTTSPIPTCSKCSDGTEVGFYAEIGCSRQLCQANCTLTDASVNSKECVVTKMEQIYTFDSLDISYDLCSHVIAKDCVDGSFEVRLNQSCKEISCQRQTTVIIGELSFEFTPDSRDFKVNGHHYDMNSITALNDVLLADYNVQMENYGNGMAVISSDVQIVHYLNGDLKVSISDAFFGKTCGMCGNANCISADDSFDEEDLLSTSPSTYEIGEQNCEPKDSFECPVEMSDNVLEICSSLKDAAFKTCHDAITMDSYMKLCSSEACDCLKSGKSVDECKCNALSAFIESCQKQTKTCSFSQWRDDFGCSTPTCPAGKVYRECGDACPRTCADILSDDKSCPVDYQQPGCFCPDGFVSQGDGCVREDQCKCVCRGWGDPHYKTYDKKYFPYQGDCTYVLSRPIANRDFEVFGHNEYCVNAPEATCTKAVTIRIGNNVITLMDDLRVIINDVQLSQTTETTSLDNDNIIIDQVYGRHLLLTVRHLQIRVLYDHLTMGFGIEVPVLTYTGKLEGLCGDCNYDTSNDNISPSGEQISDSADFVASWKLTNACSSEDDFLCNTCVDLQTTTPSLPENNTCADKCDILNDEIFDSCRQVVDFAPYVESCIFDACSGTKSCYSVAAVADACREMGICIDWRSKSTDDCEVECADERVYSHCESSCDSRPLTCADVKEKRSQYACELTETCICPEGQVENDGECIDIKMCPSCLEKYPEGAVWRNESDPCIEYTCVNSAVQVTEFACECLVEPKCGQYEDLITVRDDESCCETYECQCNQDKCPAEPECEQGAVLRTIETDCCPEYVCIAPTCDVVEKNQVFTVEDCTTVQPITVTVCEGSCGSASSLMETFSSVDTEKSCSCCTGVEFETENVELLCPGGFQVSHQMRRITKCQCNATQCGGN